MTSPNRDNMNAHTERCLAGKRLNPKGCWCSEDEKPGKPLSAEEIFREIHGIDNRVYKWSEAQLRCIQIIDKGLTEFAEARVKDCQGKFNVMHAAYSLAIDQRDEIRDKTFEEAAKIVEADKFIDHDHKHDIAAEIRARKSKPQRTIEKPNEALVDEGH